MIFCYFYQRREWKIAVLLISIIPAANKPKQPIQGLEVTALERFAQVLDVFSGDI